MEIRFVTATDLIVEVQIKIDPGWFDFCLDDIDLFRTSYCGYWARGYEIDGGWLIYENCDKPYSFEEEPDYSLAMSLVNDSKQVLPIGWHRLNKEIAINAFIEGVKRWGVNWYKDADAEKYDVVIQLALLGEIRYG